MPGVATGTSQVVRFRAGAQYALLAGPLLTMLDSSIVNVAVEPIARQTDASLPTVQWIVSGYLLALGTGLALTSYLSRRFGIIPTYTGFLAAFTAASALCGVAPGVGALIAARVLQGLAGAPLVPLAMSMLLGGSGGSRRMSPAAGVLLFLGPALGPSIGGMLLGAVGGGQGWRAIFLINVPIGLLAVAAARRLPTNLAPPAEPAARPDLAGLGLLATGLVAVFYGVDQVTRAALSPPETWGPIVGGVAVLAIYAFRSGRVAHPALDLSILRQGTVALAFTLCGAASVAAWSIVFVVPIFLESGQGHSAFMTGVTLLPQGIVTGVGTLAGAGAAARIGVRPTVLSGFALLVASSAGLFAIGAGTPLWLTGLILTARAAAVGLVITPLVLVATEPLRPEQQADANTAFNVVQRVLGSFGIGIVATLFTHRAAAAGQVSALHTVAIVITILAALATLAAVFLPEARAENLLAMGGQGKSTADGDPGGD
ncbi:MFS transporter [Frankia sp. CNm7]|uniref:MFS transporter n=2 Tax=Frankia nepalensis TaxID=1836974 RepID=A0A937USG5_9ACTN|nr:MFS transporter [Frankia nepalensis]MBL7508699.1 MFS transporter [Frankia nepalensis]MBL7520667.1 MFS transporter [Frankia nepalensis]MBL7628861.1 MFS transporter [Frankia nepalensis]